jgi:hypothetical protein
MNRSPQAARRVIVKSSLNGKVPPILRHAGPLFQVPSFDYAEMFQTDQPGWEAPEQREAARDRRALAV